MTEHLLTIDGTFEMPKYRVEAFGSDPDPYLSVVTVGGWNIEGDYLCVYSDGLKQAYRIPDATLTIVTTEIKPDPLTDPLEKVTEQIKDPETSEFFDIVRRETPDADQ